MILIVDYVLSEIRSALASWAGLRNKASVHTMWKDFPRHCRSGTLVALVFTRKNIVLVLPCVIILK